MAAEEFFTVASVSSLAVAASAVNVTANALYRYAKVDQKKTAFVGGLVIAYLNVFVKINPHWAEWLVAFLNGCLLFCTAMGINDVLVAPARPRRKGMLPSQVHEGKAFFTSWWKWRCSVSKLTTASDQGPSPLAAAPGRRCHGA